MLHTDPNSGALYCTYVPRDQFVPFHLREQRFACMVCHRRAGKTVASVNDLQDSAVCSKLERPRFHYIAPQLKQAKGVAWDHLKAAMQPLRRIGATINESELRVDYPSNGGQVRIYGADNPDSFRGLYSDGVVLDEFGDMDPRVWTEILRPAIADRMGWAVFIGTPKAHNHFYDLWTRASKDPENWFTLMLKASETKLVSEKELASWRREMSPDEYNQEAECSFDAAIKGAFYADEMQRMEDQHRITTLPIDRAIPVHTAWDLGRRDSTAIWFIQCVSRERRIIDYYEASGVSLPHYAKVLREKREEHGYEYAEHWFPHDVEVMELSTDNSRRSTLEGLGVPVTVVSRHNVLDGINAVRRMLDRVWIDRERCERGIQALKQYRRIWDAKLKDWKQDAYHDWSSHGADALRMFACGYDDPIGVARASVDRHRRWRDPEPGSMWAE